MRNENIVGSHETGLITPHYKILTPKKVGFGHITTVEDVLARRERRFANTETGSSINQFPEFLKEVDWNSPSDVAMAQSRMSRLAREAMDPARREVHVDVPERVKNLRQIRIADHHLTDVHADDIRLEKAFEDAMLNENVVWCIHGDVEAGAHWGIPETMLGAAMPPWMQTKLVRERYIHPLYEQGKIAFNVTGYGHHPEWGDLIGYYHALNLLSGTDVPIVTNAGRVVWHYLGDSTEQIEVAAHNAGGGKGPTKPLGSVHSMMNKTSSRGATLGVGGHEHTISASGVTSNADGGRVAGMLIGSEKWGDPYLVKKGLEEVKPGGTSISRQEKGGSRDWSVYSDDAVAARVQEALEVLEITERRNITDEVIDKGLSTAFEGGRLFTRRRKESTRARTAVNAIKQLDTVAYRVPAEVPVQMTVVQNTGLGTTHADMTRLEDHLKAFGSRSNIGLLLGRNLVSPEALADYDSKDPNRYNPIGYLDELGKLVSEHVDRGNLAGLLLAGDLADKRWRTIHKSDPEERWDKDEKFEPATYLIRALGGAANVALLENEARVTLSFPALSYITAIFDHLQWNGSMEDPTAGLVAMERQMYQTHRIRLDASMGGHMVGSSAQAVRNVDGTISAQNAPGWYSYFSRGKSNKRPGGMPGNSLIFLPDTRFIIPTIGMTETNDVGRGVTAQYVIKNELVTGKKGLMKEVDRLKSRKTFVFEEKWPQETQTTS